MDCMLTEISQVEQTEYHQQLLHQDYEVGDTIIATLAVMWLTQ